MANVAPGSYIVMAKSGSGDQEMTAFQRIVLRALPYAPPPSRAPEYGVTLKLSPPLSINGRLFVESREVVDLRGASVALISVDPDLPSPRSVFPRPDGQFSMNGLVPGNYVLDITNLPGDLYIKVARFGTDDILEKPLTLETVQTQHSLQVLFGSDGGHLQVGGLRCSRQALLRRAFRTRPRGHASFAQGTVSPCNLRRRRKGAAARNSSRKLQAVCVGTSGAQRLLELGLLATL